MSPASETTTGPITHTFELAEREISLDLPAGWEADGFIFSPEGGAEPPTGRGLAFWTVLEVFPQPCRAEQGRAPDVEQRVDAVADAILAQPGRNRDLGEVTLDGYGGRQIQVQVPLGVDVDSCWEGLFLRWRADQTFQEHGGRYNQGAGQFDRLWVLDVDGQVLLVDVSFFPETSAADRAELMRMVGSVRFRPAR